LKNYFKSLNHSKKKKKKKKPSEERGEGRKEEGEEIHLSSLREHAGDRIRPRKEEEILS